MKLQQVGLKRTKVHFRAQRESVNGAILAKNCPFLNSGSSFQQMQQTCSPAPSPSESREDSPVALCNPGFSTQPTEPAAALAGEAGLEIVGRFQ